MANKRTFKIHIFDLIAAMVFLGKKVTPEDVAEYFYQENWGDADKWELRDAVKVAFEREMKKQTGSRPEDHYGIRKHPELDVYWLNYKISEV